MRMDRRSRLRLRVQHALFVVLWTALVVLAGWLAQEYKREFDWTAGGRNTLSEVSQRVVERLQAPVEITAYARPDEMLRKRIEDLVARYRRARPDAFELRFVNPDREPERVRELGIRFDGTLVVRYRGRTEQVSTLSEQALTGALERLMRAGARRLVFLTGHGERSPEGAANHDLGRFGRELERRGIRYTTVNLARTPELPKDGAVLVIASPATALLPGEARIVREWVARGGNLLWLLDPGEGTAGLEALLGTLGLKVLPGTVVDASAPVFGINDPTFVVVPEYPSHPITSGLRLITLFPRAAALEAAPKEGWHASQVLRTLPRAWNETGPLRGELRPDPDRGERTGPLTLAVALTRPRPAVQEDGQAANAKGEASDKDAGETRAEAGEETAAQAATPEADPRQGEQRRAHGAAQPPDAAHRRTLAEGDAGPPAKPQAPTAEASPRHGEQRRAHGAAEPPDAAHRRTLAKGDAGPPAKPQAPTAEASPRQGEQRILVVGDGDFLANAYLGNGGNLDLGLAMVNWLLHDDVLVQVPAKAAPDRSLALSRTASALIGVGFLLVLPLGLIGTGVLIWWRRSRR